MRWQLIERECLDFGRHKGGMESRTNARVFMALIEFDKRKRGCTRLALNFTPLPQDFKLPGGCAEVKPKFAFFQEQREEFAFDSVVFA